MAITIGAVAGRSLTRTTSLPGTAVAAMSGLVYNSGAGVIACLESSGGAAGFYLYINAGAWHIWNTAQRTFSASPSVNQWVAWFIANAGTGATDLVAGWAAQGSSTWTTNTVTGVSFTPAQLTFGNEIAGTPLDGTLDNLKFWSAAPSANDLLTEKDSGLPHRFSNLAGHWPLWRTGDVKDYSGNGLDLTENGTLTSAQGGPIGGGRRKAHPLIIASAAPPATGRFFFGAAAAMEAAA